MLRKTLALLTILASLAFAGSAVAETVCGERGEFLSYLAKTHAEAPAAVGLASNGSVVEVLTSKRGSWTLLVTMANGTACVLGAGEAWERVPAAATDPQA